MTGSPADPATKADLAALERRIAHMIDDKVDEKLVRANAALLNEFKRHFDVTVETIRHDLLGANKDEISLLSDTLINHAARIEHLERLSGVPS